MKTVQADYVPSSLPAYRGNRYIEALPDYLSYTTRAIAEALQIEPEPIHPQASRRQRSAWLSSLNHEFFVPLARHIQLQETIDLMIREGYAKRCPRGNEHWSYYMDAYKRLQEGEKIKSLSFDGDSKADPMSATLIGCSGIGKSYGLSQILNLYPQVIEHQGNVNQIRTSQIVYLLVQCPHEGSVKSLCANIIAEISKATGENYTDEIVTKRPTLQVLKVRLAHLMALHRVGLLVIDEIQNLATNKKSRTELFNFIVDLANSLSVPILYVGTPKLYGFMQKDLRIARRFASFGVLDWDRLYKGTPEWNTFISALSRVTLLKDTSSGLSQELIDALYECSQGIVDILIKLFILTQLNCMALAQESLSPEAIYAVFEKHFKNVKPMIEALRNGDSQALDNYEDIRLPESEFKKAKHEIAGELEDNLEAGNELESQELSGLRKISNIYITMNQPVPQDVKDRIAVLERAKENFEREAKVAGSNKEKKKVETRTASEKLPE